MADAETSFLVCGGQLRSTERALRMMHHPAAEARGACRRLPESTARADAHDMCICTYSAKR